MRFKVGIYGVIINLFLVLFNFLLYFLGIYNSIDVFIIGGFLFLLASFFIYFLVIPLYLRRRKKVERHVIVLDVLIGIIAELAIFLVACTIYSFAISIVGLTEGMRGVFSGFIIGIFVPVMFFIPVIGYQFLLFGVFSGVAGWYILRNTTIIR